ncbi:MAG: two-component system, OmpR family, sensor kinase, partial [Actinomycetota bacterium]|nr:two-component system, OmpR family, sensor kinase [Actinomycetota bacterium]
MKRLSLRARLLLLTAGLLLAGLGLIGAVVSDHVERYQLDRLDGQLRSLTELISRVPAAGPPGLKTTNARPELLDPALDLFGTPYLVYLGADGSVAGGIHSSRLDTAALPSPGALRTIPADGTAADLPAADG